MHILLRDLRYAQRQLFKSPGFTLTSILTLALGIGAKHCDFQCDLRLLLQTLPFRDAGRIVSILETHPQVANGAEATYPDYLDCRAQQKSFEQVAAYSVVNPSTVSLVVNGMGEQVHRVLASGNFFSTLGVSPLLGRTLNEQDEKAGGDHVAVLSATAWQRYFGADASVVGRSIDLNGTSFTVVGVLLPGAAFPTEGDVWLPLSLLRLALSHTAGVDLAPVQSIGLNIPVLLLTLSACVLTAVFFGLLPVAKTFSSLAEAFFVRAIAERRREIDAAAAH